MKYKKFGYTSIFLAFFLCTIIIFTAKIYPFEKLDVICEELSLQNYEEYCGRKLPQNRKTQNVYEEPEKYLIINYWLNVKNNTSKTLFVEDYSLSIPKYKTVYFENGMDFYSQYEYMPSETNNIFGRVIIYIGDNDRQKVLSEVTKSIKFNMWYWVYYNDLVSLLAFSTM